MKENSQRLVIVTAVSLITIIVAIMIYARFFSGGDNGIINSGSGSTNIDYSVQPVLGDNNAPVKVVLFEDFLCPHCASFTESILPQLKREYSDNENVAFFFINFPLGSFGPPSIASALAGECVYEQSNEAFWEFKTVLMRSQRNVNYTAKGLAELADQYVSGLNVEELETCIEENRHSEKVSNDREIASSAASSTPAILVNGELVTDAHGDSDPSLSSISAAIEQALSDL